MSNHCAAWRRSSSVGVALLTAALGSGCSDDSYRLGGGVSGLSGPAGHREGPCENGADIELIDSMEDQDSSIELSHGRSGNWYAFDDGSDGTQDPPVDAASFPMAKLDPARGRSHYSARERGGNFKNWGAGMAFDFKSKQPYDASHYAGISFWARRSADSDDQLLFAVPDRNTSPLAGVCDDRAGLCTDDFGAKIKLSTEFEYFSFTWAEMAQVGWSLANLKAIDTAHLYGVRFVTDLVPDFDFWIDDVALLCHP
ncbi:MAG TPA: hypothetical protein VEQ58_15055 [Polyangiaceae bacterium]|nr:hypothetical protein [Polyangiaceae bacterium]